MQTNPLITIAAAAAVLSSSYALASSHREAPFITKYPQVDATDFYLFNSYEPGRENFVTMIANYLPLQAAYGGPNYFPLDSEALYEIYIDNDGDAVQDLTYRFRFSDSFPVDGPIQLQVGDESISSVLRNIGVLTADGEPGLTHTESYTIGVRKGDRPNSPMRPATNAVTGEAGFAKPFDYAGTKSFGGPGMYDSYAASFIHDVNLPGCKIPARVFVGQRNEAFKISLGEVFDLVNLVPIEGDSSPGAADGFGFPGGITQDPERNILARNNVTSIALEVHRNCLLKGDSTIVGGWTTASLPRTNTLNADPTFDLPETGSTDFVQVSRLGSPLVNELVIGYDLKDRFNSSEPRNDVQFLKYVTNPGLPAILDSLFLGPVNDTFASFPGFVPFTNLAPENFPRNDLVAAFLTGVEGLNQFANPTPGEMLRLNTAIDATPRELQRPLGVIDGDLAGFPNGRRPGDDSVDIALRVVMGVLCYDLPLGSGGTPVNLGLCSIGDAPVGSAPFTDGAPLSAADLNQTFPYLLTPYPGSPVGAPLPQPTD